MEKNVGHSRKKNRKGSGIGGQAVLEGVMMKNKSHYAVAVRKPDGRIEVKTGEFGDGEEKGLRKIPFVRGVFNLYDSLVLGTRSINYSASFYEDDEKEKTAADKAADKVSGDRSETVFSVITVIASFLIAIAVFIVLPYYLAVLLDRFVRNSSLLALFEALIRILIFLIYVCAIALMKDIRRVYMYHGAEHKCINCIERGRELTVENVRKSSRYHKRCGTSFLLFVVFLSAVLFFFIRVGNPFLRILIRIALIPVIAGIAYEIIRLAGRSDNIFVRIISAPGKFLQRLTTREPDDDMIEVGIASVEAVFDWKQYFKDEFGYDVDDAAEVLGTMDEADKTISDEEIKNLQLIEEEEQLYEDTEYAEDAGYAEDAEYAGDDEDVENAQYDGSDNGVIYEENTEYTEDVEYAEDAEYTEEVEYAEDAEYAEDVEYAEEKNEDDN